MLVDFVVDICHLMFLRFVLLFFRSSKVFFRRVWISSHFHIFVLHVLHWFRSIVFLHLGGKRHGCHFIVFNGSAQWFAGAHSWRSLLSPSVFTEAFSLLNGSANHFCLYFVDLFCTD